jgi:hypothetical protein
MNVRMLCSFLALVLSAGTGATADEGPKQPQKPVTPLKLQIVFSRYLGEKKVASLPYSLSANANGEATHLHMGIQIPLKYEGKDTPGNVVYKNAGNDIECSVEALDDARFKVRCNFRQSSVYSVDGDPRTVGEGPLPRAPLLPPILKNFETDATLILRDGQTAQHTAAADPVSGELVRIDVTLSVVK